MLTDFANIDVHRPCAFRHCLDKEDLVVEEAADSEFSILCTLPAEHGGSSKHSLIPFPSAEVRVVAGDSHSDVAGLGSSAFRSCTPSCAPSCRRRHVRLSRRLRLGVQLRVSMYRSRAFTYVLRAPPLDVMDLWFALLYVAGDHPQTSWLPLPLPRNFLALPSTRPPHPLPPNFLALPPTTP
jgi:hypothetical protein